jgi:tetratricopeptide (TPR) repeat protein
MRPMIIIAILAVALFTSPTSGQSTTFKLGNQILILDTAIQPQTILKVIQDLSTMNQKSDWRYHYHLAYAYTRLGMVQNRDSHKEKSYTTAFQHASMAMKLSSGNSEVHALFALILQMQLQLSPMTRGRSYAQRVNDHIDKAIKLDPSNPRPYFLRAQMLYNTPSLLGGDKKKAIEYYRLATERFARYQPPGENYPIWGKKENQEFSRKATH